MAKQKTKLKEKDAKPRPTGKRVLVMDDSQMALHRLVRMKPR